MSDTKVFLDSNILIYSYSNSEPEKQLVARNLILENDSWISTQVLQELTRVVTHKFNFSFLDAEKVIVECMGNNHIWTNSATTIIQACGIAHKYRFSFYDSLIIASALESGCEKLFSEDLQHNQVINNTLTIINPFNS